MAVLLSNAMVTDDDRTGPIRALLQRLGPGADNESGLAGLAKVMLAYDPADADAFQRRLARLARDPDRNTALPASHWLSHVRENAGDPAGAIDAAECALVLVGDDEGPGMRRCSAPSSPS